MTQVFDPDDVAADVANLLEDMAVRAKEGDVLGEIEGVAVKKTKERTMVSYNGVELPARTRVYDRRGFPSDVPTAQLAYHLNKKLPGGERAFYSSPDRIPGGAQKPVPIDETCEWCEKRAGKRVKVFYDFDDYEAHCEYFHPREWASKLRREDRANNVTSVAGILKLLAGLSQEQREALVGGP